MRPIIHQTWRDQNIPEQWRDFVEGWKRYPHTLWTDEMIEDFMSQVHFWENYRTKIEKIDAARYFILKEFGGVYVDVDCQLLKDIAPLLVRSFVAGLEPKEHAERHNQKRIISNALMAAEQGNKFLEYVCGRLEEFQHEKDPLRSTGPFFLTRMYEDYEDKDQVLILGSEYFSPLVKNTLDQVSRIEAPKNAYAVHYYWGSWWR